MISKLLLIKLLVWLLFYLFYLFCLGTGLFCHVDRRIETYKRKNNCLIQSKPSVCARKLSVWNLFHFDKFCT